MLKNRYLRKLVVTYSGLATDVHETDDTVKQAAAVVYESFNQLGIDINKMPNEVLMYHILNLYGQLSGSSDTISPKEYEKASVKIAQQLKSTEFNYKSYGHSYDKHNRSFSSNNSLKKIMKAIVLASTFLKSLLFPKLNAAEVNSYIASNPEVVVSVIEKSLIEQSLLTDTTRKEGGIIKYRPEEYVQNLPPHVAPAVTRIKSTIESKAKTWAHEIYKRFEEAGALTPLPQNDSLDVTTRLSLRIYWSAKYLYRQFLNKGRIPFDKILEADEKTEIATQYIVFSAFAYNILSKLDYTLHNMETEQIKGLIHDLRYGMYDVKFKNKNNETVHRFSQTMLIQMLNSDMEFEIVMHEIEILGLEQVDHGIKGQLNNHKVAIGLVEGKPFYDLYVVLPTTITQDAMNPVHEVVFRIRCSLTVEGVKPANISRTNLNMGPAQLRDKKTSLFRRKKKYDWM
jgi:hypothetical protein